MARSWLSSLLSVITFFDNLWHRRAQAGDRASPAHVSWLQRSLWRCTFFPTVPPASIWDQHQRIDLTNHQYHEVTPSRKRHSALPTESPSLFSPASVAWPDHHPINPCPHVPSSGRSASRETRRIFQWFACVFVFYFLAVGTGLYAYRNFGYRYSLIIAPFFVLALAATIERLAQRKQLLFASALFLAVLSIASVQNAVGSRAWPETREDLRSVAICWEQHRNESDPTYVYYGAVPGFAYYRQARALESPMCPRGSGFDPGRQKRSCRRFARPSVGRRDVSGLFFPTSTWMRTRRFSPGFPSNTVLIRFVGAWTLLPTCFSDTRHDVRRQDERKTGLRDFPWNWPLPKSVRIVPRKTAVHNLHWS